MENNNCNSQQSQTKGVTLPPKPRPNSNEQSNEGKNEHLSTSKPIQSTDNSENKNK